MTYSWIEDISVGASVDWDDIKEIRDNLDATDDDSCTGGCPSHYLAYNEIHDTGHWVGHYETHMNPHLSGHQNDYDSGMQNDYRLVENAAEKALHDTGHQSGHDGTDNTYHNPSNWGNHYINNESAMYGIHDGTIETGDNTGYDGSDETLYKAGNDAVYP